MGQHAENQTDRRRRERLAARAEQMVESGRLTCGEAERLRAADGPGEVDDAVRDIRVRHATAALDVAVGDGTMTQEEADGFIARLRCGEHMPALRGRLRHRSGVSSRADSSVGASPGPRRATQHEQESTESERSPDHGAGQAGDDDD